MSAVGIYINAHVWTMDHINPNAKQYIINSDQKQKYELSTHTVCVLVDYEENIAASFTGTHKHTQTHSRMHHIHEHVGWACDDRAKPR